MNERVVHSAYLGRLIEYVQRHRALEEVFPRVRFPDASGPLRGLDVPVDRIQELSEMAARALGEPNLGVRVAQTLAPTAYARLESMLRLPTTLGEALQEVVRSVRRVHPTLNVSLRPVDRFVWVAIQDRIAPAGAGSHHNRFVLTLVVGMIRRMSASAWSPVAVRLPESEAEDLLTLERLFSPSRISFGVEAPAFALRTSDLELELQPGRGGAIESRRPGVVGDASEAVLQALMRGWPLNIEVVAERLETSSRTLQRRLRMEQSSFSSVLDEVRCAQACEALRDPTRRIEDVAQCLGYTHVRAFLRAFKRWTGMTPSAYRKEDRAGR